MWRGLSLRWGLALAIALAATAAATTAAAATTTASLIWRLPERVNLPLDEVAVVLAIRVVATQLQRRIVCLNRIRPFLYGVLRSGLLDLLTRAIQCIAEVVVSILLI